MSIFQVEGFHEFRICSLQVVSDRFLLVLGCFRSFLAHGRSFHVLALGCFRSFLARCRSFQVVPRLSKYESKSRSRF